MHPTYWGLNPAPLCETRKMFEDKWIVMGNVDTASFLNKNPAQIYEESKAQVDEGKNFKNGFIAGIGCEMPPFATYVNVEAFTRAVSDHGKLK
jgi:uroporphyrinogen-III decarboxylase